MFFGGFGVGVLADIGGGVVRRGLAGAATGQREYQCYRKELLHETQLYLRVSQ